MRKLSDAEILSLNSLLASEVNGLAVAHVIARSVDDQRLKDLTQSGIDTCEARIRTIQQFLNENHVIQGGVQ